MLRLLNCQQGHFWESVEDNGAALCPECGRPAESLPLLDLAPAVASVSPAPSEPGEQPLFDADHFPIVAGYQVLEQLGRAPTAIRLYRARQQVTGRQVLLKVVVACEEASQQAWNSLRGEASALGKLSHPNIIHIHEAGERDRQLFYNATELVEGPTLAQKVVEQPLPPRQIIRLMELLARAIDHAHAQGILHRNLKPSSVLLQPTAPLPRESPAAADPPGASCLLHTGCYIPRLTDFGLARKPIDGDPIDLELFGDQAGFLSPEQAWGRAREIGPTTDVYGLGGILYFLLCGRPPFRGPTVPDVLDAIQTADLVPPSQSRRVPADLEAICKKCLSRLPRKRYASAGALADDLRRAAVGLPLQARPASGITYIGKWLRRHPASAGMILLGTLGLLGMVIAYSTGRSESAASDQQLQQMRRQLAQTSHERDALAHELQGFRQKEGMTAYRQFLDEAQRELARGNPLGARTALERCGMGERGFEWYYLQQRTQGRGKVELRGPFEGVSSLVFVPGDSRRLVLVTNRGVPRTGQVWLWDLMKQVGTATVANFPGPVHAVAIRGDGQQLATAGGDATDENGDLRLFRLGDGVVADKPIAAATFPTLRLTDVAYPPDDGRLLVTMADGRLARILASTGTMERSTTPPFFILGRRGMTRLALNPDASEAVVFTENASNAESYDTTRLQPVRGFPGNGVVTAVAMGREGLTAVARADSAIRIHAGPGVIVLPVPRTARRLAFSADGTRLAAGCEDDTVRIWGRAGAGWVELLTLQAKGLADVSFSPSGRALVTASPTQVVVWGSPGE